MNCNVIGLNAWLINVFSTYSVSNLVVPLQLNWEKNLKNIVKDSEAIFPSFLAHYTPNEPSTILVC